MQPTKNSAAVAGYRAVSGALSGSIKAAAEAEVSQKKLQAQLKASGISYKQYGTQIDDTLKKQSQLSAFDDEELADSFTGLVRATGDVNKALELNALAVDMARAKGMSLEAAAMQVTKAQMGQIGALRRVGIEIEKVTTAQDALGKGASDAAKEQAKAADLAATKQKAIALLQQKFAGQAKAYGDLIAGLACPVVNILQAMAHALLATVNPVLGLSPLMLATPVGALFTSATFMNVSTTSALAVAAGDTLINYPSSDRASVLVTLVLLIGVFQVVLGVFRLGWVTRFIPFSVMTGFMTGVAVLIIIGQLGDFTGYYSSYSGKITQLADLLLNRQSIEWATLAIGLMTILLIYWLGSTRLSKFSLVLGPPADFRGSHLAEPGFHYKH